MSVHEESFLRAAHPAGRLARIGLWVALALAFALRSWIGGIGASIMICVGLMIAVITLRDKIPEAEPNTGLFWRIAEGERIVKAGGAPPEMARSVDFFSKIAMVLALLGVGVSAWLGPVGLGFTLAGPSGYTRNYADGNNGSNANPQVSVSGGVQIGTNACGGDLICP